MEEQSRKPRKVREEEDEQEIWSWGAGTDGQLGTGRLEDDHLPQLLHLPSLSSLGPISLLACGGAHVIALTAGGRVLTWGRGTSGQLGHGENANSLYPNPVTSLESYTIINVAAGWNHSGFVSDSGCLFSCGDGSFGQLGHGDYRSHCSPVKVSYFVNKHVRQVACGMRHSLVLLRDSSKDQVYGFGSGKRGQLGISMDMVKSINLPQVTLGFEDVEITNITANGDHSAALSAEGHLYTWGRGFAGTSSHLCPQRLSSSLLFTGDGEVFMLGGSHHGALGYLEKLTPEKHSSEDFREAALEKVHDTDGAKVMQIAAGAEHSAFVTEKGVVKTWGWGEHGQLGFGSTRDETDPQVVNVGQELLNQDFTVNVYCGSGFTYALRRRRLPFTSPS
ncbi:ultraviolet-B receptor UVR8 isoform X2 [Carica papaya]|uniref:ultraviolet-B receptor UVR8 isoform X2 n=1 Tax=Carica papaya TaxID=3649 RepID=UPI000B8D08C8|nr:ultraviolet-B receptor UVR8 isoform X2 [Carica papaya]